MIYLKMIYKFKVGDKVIVRIVIDGNEEQFFRSEILNMGDGIGNMGHIPLYGVSYINISQSSGSPTK